MQCTLIFIGGLVSGTFVGALSIAAAARIGAAVADDVLASLIELRGWWKIHYDGTNCYAPQDGDDCQAALARADRAICHATEGGDDANS
jgi:hypothetical protein